MSARTCVPSRTARRAVLVLVAAVGAVGTMLASGAPAAATADTNSLQSIDPPNGAALPTSPTAITLTFGQEVRDDDQLSLSLGCNSQPQTPGEAVVDDAGLVVTYPITTPLPRGACTISWTLADAEGNSLASDFSTFSVTSDPPEAATATAGSEGGTGSAPATSTPPSSTTDQGRGDDEGSTGGAIWLGRLLSTMGILVLFGGLALISVGWPEGPEYVVTVRYLRAVWLLGLLGTVLYLVAFAADFNDSSIGAALSPGAWLDLKDAGWPGRGALMRLVLVAASGWVAMRPERIIDPTTSMWAWGLPGFALVAVALSRTDGSVPALGFVVGVLHLLGTAVWIGGVALVARVVLAGPGEDDLVQATRAFSRISVPAMLVTAVTGIIQMIRLDGGDVFGSSHGRVLLLKVIAVAAMLAVALAVRQQVALRLDRAHEMTAPLADRFRRAFGAEAALGVVVLAFSGWLLALTPPKVDPHGEVDYAVELPFVDQASGIDATVSITPAKVGANGIRVQVHQPAEGITNFVLRFIPPAGSGAFVVEQPVDIATAGIKVLDQDDGLPFTVAGEWTLELTAATTTGALPGAQSRFFVADADGTPTAGDTGTGTGTGTGTDAGTSEPLVSSVLVPQSTTTAPFATTSTTTSTTVP